MRSNLITAVVAALAAKRVAGEATDRHEVPVFVRERIDFVTDTGCVV